EALKSDVGQQLLKEAKSLIETGAKQLAELLVEVSEPLRSTLIKAFSRASTLLAARSPDNKGWWCHCYGLRKINCGGCIRPDEKNHAARLYSAFRRFQEILPLTAPLAHRPRPQTSVVTQ